MVEGAALEKRFSRKETWVRIPPSPPSYAKASDGKPENFAKQNLSDNQEPITCNLRYKKLKIKDVLINYISRWARSRRDAREAEGARLEIVYSANNGIEGSNPSLSAMYIVMYIIGLRDENLSRREGGIGSATRRGGGGSEATEHIPLSPPDYAKASSGRPSYLADEAPKERSGPLRLRLAGQKIRRANFIFDFSPIRVAGCKF